MSDGAKPICDCGTLLQLRQETIYEETVKINKNHKLSKRFKVSARCGGTGCDWLECPKCHKEYIFDMFLANGVVVRGKERKMEV